MVECRSKPVASRHRGSSRVLFIAFLAVTTSCLVLSVCSGLQRSQSRGSLLGDPFEPDSQDEQKVNQADQSERLLGYPNGLRDGSDDFSSGIDDGTSKDTDEVRRLRRDRDSQQGARSSRQTSPSFTDFDSNGAVSGIGSGMGGVGLDSTSGTRNYNVNILNGQGSDVSSALSYIKSPVAGYGSDLVGGDITSSLNRNIRDIQKLQQQFSAPEHARRRSKLALLRRDDKMLQNTLLDTLKLQERQMNAQAAATKRLAASLQHMRGRTEQELQQRATSSQLNDAMFDLKRVAAMQQAEYKSLMLMKARPGAPGLPGVPGPPGPPGLNGRNGANGSPGSVQQLVPVGQSRLVVSPDGQRSWDIHPPIPPPHRRCQDDDLSCNSQNNPNTWGSARRDPNASARSGMKQALAQRNSLPLAAGESPNGIPFRPRQAVAAHRHHLSARPSGHWADEDLFKRKSAVTGRSGLSFLPPSLPPANPPPYVPFPNRIETMPNGAKYQTHWVSPDGQRSWDIHPPIPPPHQRCQDDDLSCNSQNNPNTWGSARRDPNASARSGMKQALVQHQRTREQEEAPLALAAPSPKALAEAVQLGVPAVGAALRTLRLARQRLQTQEQNRQPMVASAVAQPSVPLLLRAEELQRSRALSNADIVMPSTLLRGTGRSDSSPYMRRTGLRHRLADVQRNQDNGGFFESPASVVVE